MTNQHGDFIWYELMTTDAQAAQRFYGGLLGWTFKDSGMPDADYRLFSANGTEVGGLLQLTEEMQQGGAQSFWAGYLAVDDTDSAAESIAKAGGEVLMSPQDIPDVGRFAFVKDAQGAHFYVMTDTSGATSESFATHKPRDGHCAWNELMTSDPAGANSFYGDVFGWVKSESMDMGPMGEYDMYRNGAERDFTLAGVMRKPEAMPVSLWNFYFRLPNIDQAVEYTNANGGRVVNDPMQVPGGDFAISGVDPQGAFFSVIGAR